MKTLILGIESATPELLFGFEDLPNLRRLMDGGAYGRIESVSPPITVPAWMFIRDQLLTISQAQSQDVGHPMQNHPRDDFQFVDIGLDQIQHGFWKDRDPHHALHKPESPDLETVHDYYRHLDLEIGKVLELLTDETIFLVVSDHGSQRPDGGVRVHEGENVAGPDECNQAQFGAFILAGHNGPPSGAIHGAHLLDILRTLLELSGYEIPSTMQGRSLVSGSDLQSTGMGD